MSAFTFAAPISTGRYGSFSMHPRYGPSQTREHIEITSIHAEVHWRTQRECNLPSDIPTTIYAMDDGGPIPTPYDFKDGSYKGPLAPRTMQMWYNPAMLSFQPQQQHMPYTPMHQMQQYMPYTPMHQMQPLPMQMPAQGISRAGYGALANARQLTQPGPTAPVETQISPASVSAGSSLLPAQGKIGQSAKQPIVIQDDDDNEAQTPIPAPEKPTHPPPRPCHLQERFNCLLPYVRRNKAGAAKEQKWLHSMRMAPYKQQQEYCRLFWPSDEKAEIDISWVSTHFENFTEAYIERKAVEAKKEVGLNWEKQGAAIEEEWLKKVKSNTMAEQMKRDFEEAEKKKVEAEKRRESRARKSTEEESEKATSLRKRNAATEPEEPAKRRKTTALEQTALPTPEGSDADIPAPALESAGNEADSPFCENVEETPNEDGLATEEEIRAGLEALFEEDSDEGSDEDEDIGAKMLDAISKTLQEAVSKSTSKPKAPVSEPQKVQEATPKPAPKPRAQTSQAKDNSEATSKLASRYRPCGSNSTFARNSQSLLIESLERESRESRARDKKLRAFFEEEAEEASEDESEEEEDEEEEIVLSENEIQLRELNAKIEEKKGRLAKATNVLLIKRLNADITQLRKQREKLL